MLTNLTETPCVCGALKSAERLHDSLTLLVFRAWESHALSLLHRSPDLAPPRHLRNETLYRGGQETTDQNDQ